MFSPTTTTNHLEYPHPLELLRVEIHAVEDTTVVVVSGDLDLASAEQLEGKLLALLERRLRQLVIDLSELEFMDLSGMRVILQCAELAAHAGIGISIEPGEGGPRRLLELCGCLELLRLASPRPAAGMRSRDETHRRGGPAYRLREPVPRTTPDRAGPQASRETLSPLAASPAGRP